jgi:hypothetical protein
VPFVNATDTAPTTTPKSNNVIATNGQTFAASSLFTTSDADGDPITGYDFWDTGSGGGRWMVNGMPGMTNTDNFVTAAQLSQVKYQAGSGTDTLWVRTSDGLQYGPWSTSFTVSDPPQVQTVQAGETLEVASPFSGSVTFAGAAGTLKLDNSSSFAGTVAGMTGQDTIDCRYRSGQGAAADLQRQQLWRHAQRDRRHAYRQHRAPRQLHGVGVCGGKRRPRRHVGGRSGGAWRRAGARHPGAHLRTVGAGLKTRPSYLSVVIVRACGRSSDPRTFGLERLRVNLPRRDYWMPHTKRGMTTHEVFVAVARIGSLVAVLRDARKRAPHEGLIFRDLDEAGEWLDQATAEG